MHDESPAPVHKDKIGRHLSYPIKFSDAMSGLAPFFDELKIGVWYWAWKAPRPNSRYATYQIASAQFSVANVHLPERWYFNVYPVPRALRAEVWTHLLEGGMQRFRDWYGLHRSCAKSSKSLELLCEFVVEDRKLHFTLK
jgi:hypothetical protein